MRPGWSSSLSLGFSCFVGSLSVCVKSGILQKVTPSPPGPFSLAVSPSFLTCFYSCFAVKWEAVVPEAPQCFPLPSPPRMLGPSVPLKMLGPKVPHTLKCESCTWPPWPAMLTLCLCPQARGPAVCRAAPNGPERCWRLLGRGGGRQSRRG